MERVAVSDGRGRGSTAYDGLTSRSAICVPAFSSSISTHLLVGVVGYRRVMTREWPKVRPLDDDEW